jgi:hypothetical protein
VTSEFSPLETELWGRKLEAGYSEGQVARVLIRVPGLTILYIWNKKGYPTPLHSHNVDCHYIVLGGSVHVGGESLSPGDAFFVPADMPYTYKVGPDGSEILEIRREGNWDLKLLAKNPAYFDKAVEAITANIAQWRVASRPSVSTRIGT